MSHIEHINAMDQINLSRGAIKLAEMLDSDSNLKRAQKRGRTARNVEFNGVQPTCSCFHGSLRPQSLPPEPYSEDNSHYPHQYMKANHQIFQYPVRHKHHQTINLGGLFNASHKQMAGDLVAAYQTEFSSQEASQLHALIRTLLDSLSSSTHDHRKFQRFYPNDLDKLEAKDCDLSLDQINSQTRRNLEALIEKCAAANQTNRKPKPSSITQLLTEIEQGCCSSLTDSFYTRVPPTTAGSSSECKCRSFRQCPKFAEFFSCIPVNAVSSQSHGPPGSNVFVFHIPSEWDELDLALLFAQFGKIVSSRIATDKSTGRKLGFGFVSYATVVGACAAVDVLNGYSVTGKRLKVTIKRGEQQYAASCVITHSSAIAAAALVGIRALSRIRQLAEDHGIAHLVSSATAFAQTNTPTTISSPAPGSNSRNTLHASTSQITITRTSTDFPDKESAILKVMTAFDEEQDIEDDEDNLDWIDALVGLISYKRGRQFVEQLLQTTETQSDFRMRSRFLEVFAATLKNPDIV